MIIEPIANSNNQQNNAPMASEVHYKEVMNKTIKERPVEDVGNDTSKKADDKKNNETTTETIIDKDKIVVFTRYDEEGNIINKVPPGYVTKA